MNDKRISLAGYAKADRDRIKVLASRFIVSRINRGEMPCTDEAIREAMPEALRDARAVVDAVNEYLS